MSKSLIAGLLAGYLLVISAAAAAEGVVCLYDQPHFRGKPVCVAIDSAHLRDIHMNDTVSSVKVYGNARVRFFEHANYGGAASLSAMTQTSSVPNSTTSSRPCAS